MLTRIMPFGAFARMGNTVRVRVVRIDPERRRLSLSIRRAVR